MIPFLKQKIVFNNVKGIAKNVVLLSALRAIRALASFVAIFFLVRILSKEQYGYYSYVLSIVAMLGIVTLPGYKKALQQSVARGKYGLLFKGSRYSFFSSLMGSVVLLSAAFYFKYIGNNPLGIPLIIASVCYPLAYGLMMWRPVLTGQEDYQKLFKADLFLSITSSSFIIMVIHLFPEKVWPPLLVLFICSIVQNIFMTFYCMHTANNREIEKSSSVYSLKISLYNGTMLASQYIDKVISLHFLSPEIVATLAVSQKIPKLLNSFTKDLAQVLVPTFARQKKYTRSTNTAIRYFALVMAAGIIIFSVFILPPIFLLLFGSEYQDAVLYAQLFMIPLIFGNFTTIKNHYILSKLDSRSQKNIQLGSAISRIISALVLIPIYGLYGAVAAALIYRLVMVIIIEIMMRRHYPVED